MMLMILDVDSSQCGLFCWCFCLFPFFLLLSVSLPIVCPPIPLPLSPIRHAVLPRPRTRHAARFHRCCSRADDRSALSTDDSGRQTAHGWTAQQQQHHSSRSARRIAHTHAHRCMSPLLPLLSSSCPPPHLDRVGCAMLRHVCTTPAHTQTTDSRRPPSARRLPAPLAASRLAAPSMHADTAWVAATTSSVWMDPPA